MMFTHATPSSPTLATTTSSVSSPISPSRPSRLRGLSYLRNYTHNLHSHNSRENTASSSPTSRHRLTRSTSYPSTGSPPQSSPSFDSPLSAAVATAHHSPALQRRTTTQASATEPQSTSGWLPSVTGHNGTASDTISSPSAAPANRTSMGRTRAGSAAVRQAGSDISEMNGGSNPQLYVSASAPSAPALGPESRPTIRFSQHQDSRAPRPSLVFSPMGRTLPTGTEVIRVGRYSERETQPNQPANLSTAAPVGFKSKVVSRRHCEFWAQDGVWYIKDVKSSSGTFLNHVRLSSPGTESKPFPVRDGDIVQLGIDFKGGEEMIFRCVKIRVELNRAWQTGLNSFNVASHQRLRNMTKQVQSNGASSSDCSICLGAVAPCQSLFVAPCSHTWHYKCVRRIINGPHWPHFVCPNCRAVADLEADVDEPTEGEWEDIDAAAFETEQPLLGSVEAAEQSPVVVSPPVPDVAPVNGAVSQSTAQTGFSTEELMANLDINDRGRTSEEGRQAGLTAPIDIVSPRRSASRQRSTDESERRTPSPSSQAVEIVDGPMTPRNDVGPFVFDGSGGARGGTPNLGAVVG